MQLPVIAIINKHRIWAKANGLLPILNGFNMQNKRCPNIQLPVYQRHCKSRLGACCKATRLSQTFAYDLQKLLVTANCQILINEFYWEEEETLLIINKMNEPIVHLLINVNGLQILSMHWQKKRFIIQQIPYRFC